VAAATWSAPGARGGRGDGKSMGKPENYGKMMGKQGGTQLKSDETTRFTDWMRLNYPYSSKHLLKPYLMGLFLGSKDLLSRYLYNL